jgi:hypothetical protein
MTREALQSKLKILIKQVYSNRTITPEEAVQYDELTKFPATFRINLKNDQLFYLIYGKRSFIAQVEGKKYYLLNLPEEQRAAESIARILRYGVKTEEGEEGGEGFEPEADTGTPAEEPATEETPIEEPET